MILSVKIGTNVYRIDTRDYHDISIPLDFYGDQPNSYNVDKAESKAYEVDGFVGDTRRGGGCNFEVVKLIPHCNGTHTECIGHITNDRFSIQKQLKDVFVPAVLISVEPKKAIKVDDAYSPELNAGDLVITRSMIEDALIEYDPNFLKALVIRTLPNDESKKSRQYMNQLPAFLSLDAMELIVEKGVNHLLIDVPSVDRTFDEGRLSAHHIFWNIEQGGFEVQKDSELNKTITEMVYMANEIPDGEYFLNLQIAPFVADASPSRPILFEIKE